VKIGITAAAAAFLLTTAIAVPAASASSGPPARAVHTMAEPKSLAATAAPRPLPPLPPTGAFAPDTASNYEYSSGYPNNDNGNGTTSGSVQVHDLYQQGTEDHTGDDYLSNHSLADFTIAGNGSETPLVEVSLISGGNYCHAEAEPCLFVAPWKNGSEYFSGVYVDEGGTYGLANNSWRPGFGANVTMGYELSYGRVNITINGHIVGYIPELSFWGSVTGWGTTIEEQVASEAYEAHADFTDSPIVSMDYTFDDFTDSNDDTLSFWGVSAPYTASTFTGGWTVSGGGAPDDDTETYWPAQSSDDNGYCITNGGSTTAGADLTIAPCSSASYEDLNWNSATGQIQIKNSGMCVDDPGDSTTGGTQLEQEPCSSGTNKAEAWHQADVGTGYLQVINANQSMCISNPTNSTTTGSKVAVETCDSPIGESQEWDWASLGYEIAGA